VDVGLSRVGLLGLLVIGVIGCGPATEEASQSPVAPSGGGLAVRVPLNAVSPGTGQAVGNPLVPPAAVPTPTPSGSGEDEPEGEPTPAPPPGEDCEDLDLTVGASCAGSTPDCGIVDPKEPVVEIGSKVVLDASYFIGRPGNKIHDGDGCYPGPIDYWNTDSSVSCREPTSNNHVITCGPFEAAGSYFFEVCGGGFCEEIYVRAE
jgi:hypothetical protein